MKYTEEIFNILSKGGFISSNSVSTQVKRLYVWGTERNVY